jgi:hypothetical protein
MMVALAGEHLLTLDLAVSLAVIEERVVRVVTERLSLCCLHHWAGAIAEGVARVVAILWVRTRRHLQEYLWPTGSARRRCQPTTSNILCIARMCLR